MAVNLKKQENILDLNIQKLEKKTGISFEGHIARVVFDIDISGSTGTLFKTGQIQDATTVILPLAMRFDDNGEMEVYVFNTRVNKIHNSINELNYENYIKNEVMKTYPSNGGTLYAPSINLITKDYDDGTGIPTYVIFLTDGKNSDQANAIDAVIQASKKNIFFQFVGIGSNSSEFKNLSDLNKIPVGKTKLFSKKREIDNTGFLCFNDLKALETEDIYEKLLEKYIEWGKEKNLF